MQTGATQIDVRVAKYFRIMSAMTSLTNPRCFMLLFHHDRYGLVRAVVRFKEAGHLCNVFIPNYTIKAIDPACKILPMAKQTFEEKSIAFINGNGLNYNNRQHREV